MSAGKTLKGVAIFSTAFVMGLAILASDWTEAMAWGVALMWTVTAKPNG